MKYIVPTDNEKMPRVHISKEGRPLCGVDLDMSRHVEREGTNDSVQYCTHCSQRYNHLNAAVKGSMSTGERAALNIRLCQEHRALEAAQ